MSRCRRRRAGRRKEEEAVLSKGEQDLEASSPLVWSCFGWRGDCTKEQQSSPRFVRPLVDKLHIDQDAACLKSWHQKACLSNESWTTRSHYVQSAVCCVNWTVPAAASTCIKSRILIDAGCEFSTRSLLHSLQFQSPLVRHLPLSQPAILPAVRRTPGISDISPVNPYI